MTCAQVEELAAELALGTVSGAERAEALDHLARCAGCRQMVDELGRVADCMLQLAPVVEPPPGFESKVLAGMGVRTATPLRASRGRRALVGIAAVALVAAMSAGAAAWLTNDGERPVELRTALAVDDEGRWTCRAVVYGEDPTWLVVTLDRTDDLSTAFNVEAVAAGGVNPVFVGRLTIQDGHGTLATSVGLPAGDVESVRVLDNSGRLRYEVTLPS